VGGDLPSLIVIGRAATQSLARTGYAAFGTDLLGVVHLMDPKVIQAGHRPWVADQDLNLLEETEAISLMTDEGRSEDQIVEYLKRRDEVKNADQSV